jgi:hypothetical protein
LPTVAGVPSAGLPLGRAAGIVTARGYGLIVLAALLLPETRGRPLEA